MIQEIISEILGRLYVMPANSTQLVFTVYESPDKHFVTNIGHYPKITIL